MCYDITLYKATLVPCFLTFSSVLKLSWLFADVGIFPLSHNAYKTLKHFLKKRVSTWYCDSSEIKRSFWKWMCQKILWWIENPSLISITRFNSNWCDIRIGISWENRPQHSRSKRIQLVKNHASLGMYQPNPVLILIKDKLEGYGAYHESKF